MRLSVLKRGERERLPVGGSQMGSSKGKAALSFCCPGERGGGVAEGVGSFRWLPLLPLPFYLAETQTEKGKRKRQRFPCLPSPP